MFKDVEKAKEAARYLKSKGFKVKLRKLHNMTQSLALAHAHKKRAKRAVEITEGVKKGGRNSKPTSPRPPKPRAMNPAKIKAASDEDFINSMSPCGGKLLTKEELLRRHQPYGGPILTWEELVNRFTPYS